MIVDVHLLEDRKLVYAWTVSQGEKGVGELYCKRKKKLESHEKN